MNKSIIKKIAIAFVLILAGLMTYAAVSPSEYSISREIFVEASPEVLFPYVK